MLISLLCYNKSQYFITVWQLHRNYLYKIYDILINTKMLSQFWKCKVKLDMIQQAFPKLREYFCIYREIIDILMYRHGKRCSVVFLAHNSTLSLLNLGLHSRLSLGNDLMNAHFTPML